VEAIVLAAGEGRRMRPLTEHWPKPVLPVDGRPVVATLLQELDGGGIGPVTVVIGHLADHVERLLEGRDVRLVRQPEPQGSADALWCALRAGASPPAVVVACDTVFTPGDTGSFAERFAVSGAVGAIAFRPVPPRRSQGIRIEDGRVARVPAGGPKSVWAAPLWAMTPELVPYLKGLPGPPFELADAFQRAIDAGATITPLEIGPTRDLTFPLDLVRQNFPYLAGL
jgi:NDP-sugar pyrophosphorylase family protein